MPLVLIIVISVSLIEAFLILPSHLGHSLAHMKARQPSKVRQIFERAFTFLQNKMFAPVLDFAIRFRYFSLGFVLLLMLAAIALPAGGHLKFVGFPSIEGDIVEARILLPQGTPLADTEKVITHITEALERSNQKFASDQPEGQTLVQQVAIFYGQNPDAFETGPHVARIVVDLLSTEVRQTKMSTFRDTWREEVGTLTDVIALKFSEPTIGPGGRAIDIRLLGNDLNALKRASVEVQNWFNHYEGVIDVSDDLRSGKREYQLHLKDTAGASGLTASQVAEQVRAAFQGVKIDEFPVGNETYEVNVRLSRHDSQTLDDLENLSLITPQGDLIPLPTLVNIKEVRGWARIHRVNGLRAVTIQGDVQRDSSNAQELLSLAQKNLFLDLKKRYPHVTVDIQGASKESAKTGQSIVRNVLLGLLGVYMLLVLQFRGYLAPITVMSVIPTALIGMMFGHWVMGLELTMPSMIGMASLFGVVVNDSILLVIFMREARAKGMAVIAAAQQAGLARFRPIILTSVTTIAGLTPLLLETSIQAQILIPMAVSLAFGLTSATLIALFLVPAIYCVLDDFGRLGALDKTAK